MSCCTAGPCSSLTPIQAIFGQNPAKTAKSARFARDPNRLEPQRHFCLAYIRIKKPNLSNNLQNDENKFEIF
jgi:hypothetical protein